MKKSKTISNENASISEELSRTASEVVRNVDSESKIMDGTMPNLFNQRVGMCIVHMTSFIIYSLLYSEIVNKFSGVSSKAFGGIIHFYFYM